MKVAGLGGAALWLPGCDLMPVLTPEFEVLLTRREDLLALRFEFANLDLQTTSTGRQLVPRGPGVGYIIVHYPPQHFLEEALDEEFIGPFLPPPRAARVSAPSRVVLKVPASYPPIPYTGKGLLDALAALEMSVAPNATPPETPTGPIIVTSGTNASGTGSLSGGRSGPPPARPQVRPRQPVNGETALELPFRLIVSPNLHARWAHGKELADGLRHGRHELWHSRLATMDPSGAFVTEGPHRFRTLRAIWTRDFETPGNESVATHPYTVSSMPDPDPASVANASLSSRERAAIVHQSSNYLDFTMHPSFVPKPIDTPQLMLSTLGGWLQAHADFTLSAPLGATVVSWDHLASMGRDYFVKIVKRGRLYPWGHRAVLIKITERKFQQPFASVAQLWQRFFIQVLEPTRDVPAAWRKFPFTNITFKTLVTPNLNIPHPVNDAVAQPIRVGSTLFRFKVVGTDHADREIPFEVTAAWMPDDNPASNAQITSAKGVYDLYPAADRTARFAAQRIAFAPNSKPDDTTYETSEIVIGGTGSTVPPDPDLPSGVPFPSGGFPFVPHLDEARLNVEAIRHLIGQEGTTAFSYFDKFLQSGFPAPEELGHANQREILFKLAGAAPPLAIDFSKKQGASGGFVNPSMAIEGLSRVTQLASDLANASQANFDPATMLPDIRLFGVVEFFKILPIADLKKAAPSFVTQALDVVTGFIADAKAAMDLIDRLKSKIQDQTTAIFDHLEELQAKLDAVADKVEGLLEIFASDPTNLDAEIDAANDLIEALDDLVDTVLADVDAIPDVLKSEKEDLKRRLKAIKNVLDAVKGGLDAFAKGLDMVKNLTVKFEWRSELQGDPFGFFVPNSMAPKGGFLLAVEARGKQVGDNPPGFSVVAGIENFKLNIFGSSAKLVTIPFTHLLFKVESGKKPEIDVVLGEIGFDGVLAFIKTLAELIPDGGFSDPPSIEVDAEGIKASFSIPIPTIAVGVFTLANMRIGAGFQVPFIGDPLSISFFFCTRDEPFVLTVMCIGGGGFVNLKISPAPAGLLLLEAALEAIACLAVDFGVASGSISIAVGVYFRLENHPGSPGSQEGEITGYLRFHGEVDVLGLISASITLLLEFTYEFASKKLVGRATLTIEVSILFFSFSVEISVERKLAGSGSDPTFLDQMGKINEGQPDEFDPWAEYLESFLLAA